MNHIILTSQRLTIIHYTTAMITAEYNKVLITISMKKQHSPVKDIHRSTQRFIFEHQISEGAFGKVFRGQDTKTNSAVAVKQLSIKNHDDIKYIKTEINILQKLKHPNIVRYLDHYEPKEGNWYIVMEYCGLGDLDKHIKKVGKMTEKDCQMIIRLVTQALHYLHTQNIAHRDIKLKNVFITEEGEIKLGDFGLSRYHDGTMNTECGTPYAKPPEVYDAVKYDGKCDVWSLGIMAYQILYNKRPFDQSTTSRLINSIKNDSPTFDPDAMVSDQAVEFIKQCLLKDPKKRPSMEQLLQIDWLAGLQNTEELNNKVKQNILCSLHDKQALVDNTCRQIVKKAIGTCLNELRTNNTFLNEQTIKRNLQIIENNFENSPQAARIYLCLLKHRLQELPLMTCEVRLPYNCLSICMKDIPEFHQFKSSLEEAIDSLMAKAELPKLSKADCERQMMKMVAEEGLRLMSMNDKTSIRQQHVGLLRQMTYLVAEKLSSSRVTITLNDSEKLKGLHDRFTEVFQRLTDEKIKVMVNRVMPSPVIWLEEAWTISHQVTVEQRSQGLSSRAAEYVLSALKIQENFSDYSMVSSQ